MYHAFSSFLLSTAVQYLMIPREEVELDYVTSYNIFDNKIYKISSWSFNTYSHSNSKIKKTLIDVARYKSLIEQSYSCIIRYFDRPDSFCELVTWPTNISDDTLAFLFNKCNLYYFIKNHIRREILSFFAFWRESINMTAFCGIHGRPFFNS